MKKKSHRKSPVKLEKRRVITAFIQRQGRILILRRSGEVGSYHGRWAGVSGYIENREEPLQRAWKEIEEETGLTRSQVKLVKEGRPLTAVDEEAGVIWIVYPYLFKAKTPQISIDWEHNEFRWIRPKDIICFQTVPRLEDALDRVIKVRSKLSLNIEVARKIAMIRANRTLGSSQLAREALETIKLASARCEDETLEGYIQYLEEVGQRLIDARPSMTPITNLVGSLIYRVAQASHVGLTLDALRRFTKLRAKELSEFSMKASKLAAKHAAQLIPDDGTVMTHSYSSTVIETFKQLAERDRNVKVFITESRPLYEGRTTARRLSNLGFTVTLITDAAAGHFIRATDLVLVGADSVQADGSLINKMGTYMLALTSKEAGVPFYVVCEKMKFNVRSYLEEKVTLEEASVGEVWMKPAQGVTVRNVYFDVTPPSLIKAYMTEEGAVKPSRVVGYMREIVKNLYIP